MKIAFVSDVVYPWTKGGMEGIHYIEMCELAKKNDVYCFCLQFEGMRKRFTKNGIHYIAVAKAKSKELYTENGTRSITLARRFANALPNAISGYSFDLVYANSFPYLHIGRLKAYCRAHGSKLVLDVAEVWDLPRWKAYLGSVKGHAAYIYAKRALTGADKYIANSSTTAKLMVEIGIPKSSIVVFSPVLKGLKPLNSKRAHTVLYSGRLIKEKRLDLWIDIVAKAHKINNSIKGLIVGTGPEEDTIKHKIAESGYSFIRLKKPFKSKKGLYRAIASSMAMLNMSEREGLSVITIESAALGTPPILPSYTPIPEEVKELALVKGINEIPKLIADIASGSIRYSPDSKKLERFSSRNVEKVFEGLFHTEYRK